MSMWTFTIGFEKLVKTKNLFNFFFMTHHNHHLSPSHDVFYISFYRGELELYSSLLFVTRDHIDPENFHLTSGMPSIVLLTFSCV